MIRKRNKIWTATVFLKAHILLLNADIFLSCLSSSIYTSRNFHPFSENENTFLIFAKKYGLQSQKIKTMQVFLLLHIINTHFPEWNLKFNSRKVKL